MNEAFYYSVVALAIKQAKILLSSCKKNKFNTYHHYHHLEWSPNPGPKMLDLRLTIEN